MFRLFRLVIDFPALDRLMDFLESSQQKEVDALTARLRATNARLRASTEKETN
jgi:hypothetical protein